MIKLLDKSTIDKIAAGEVIERPSSVVKELLENSIDSHATTITVEIKEGGTTFIRVTDNGCGISKEEVRTAYMRHATSKIDKIEDLDSIATLGFRGEALSTIAAVSQTEMVTKTEEALTGVKYVIHGGEEVEFTDVGVPEGTTIVVRNLFFNTPARKKFLKTPMTEGSYISDLVLKIALSHPDISFRLISNGQTKLSTTGNGNVKDTIYQLFGKDITNALLKVNYSSGNIKIEGYIAKPYICRGNRGLENYYVNNRYIKSNIVNRAIEEAYKTYVMQHKFPFAVLFFTLPFDKCDVNVHPTKMEFKYDNERELFDAILKALKESLAETELIPPSQNSGRANWSSSRDSASVNKPNAYIPKPSYKAGSYSQSYNILNSMREQEKTSKNTASNKVNTSVENNSNVNIADSAVQDNNLNVSNIDNSAQINNLNKNITDNTKQENNLNESITDNTKQENNLNESITDNTKQENNSSESSTDNTKQENNFDDALINKSDSMQLEEKTNIYGTASKLNAYKQSVQLAEMTKTADNSNSSEAFNDVKGVQLSLFNDDFLSKEARVKHHVIGQLFDTYWLIEYDRNLYIMDQHAAHEKIKYEELMRNFKNREILSQQLMPPMIVTVTYQEREAILNHFDLFMNIGYDIEEFGGNEFKINAVPANIYGLHGRSMFMDFVSSLIENSGYISNDIFVKKLSTMACKAAIKGNTKISIQEAEHLVDELLKLDNPYTCPHGRPTIISMSEAEIEKKFRRIV